MRMPIGSVIIPTFKHEEYVLGTLESVFAQTMRDYEVIVVNDGSPDGTSERLRPLVEGGRIRYFEQANAGQAPARNRGLKEARGEFVAFLDDDDLWPADKLQWQVQAMKEDATLSVIAGEPQLIDAEGSPLAAAGPLRAMKGDFESLFGGCAMYSP